MVRFFFWNHPEKSQCYRIFSDKKMCCNRRRPSRLAVWFEFFVGGNGVWLLSSLPKSTSGDRTYTKPEMNIDWVCPQMERRGIHLPIHPIEGYFDTWEPGNHERAYRLSIGS